MPFLLDEWPYSPYFSLDKNSPKIVEKVLRKNSENLLLSQNIIALLPGKSHSFQNNSDFAVGIITTQRSGLAADAGYLTQTVAYLLQEVYRNLLSHGGE